MAFLQHYHCAASPYLLCLDPDFVDENNEFYIICFLLSAYNDSLSSGSQREKLDVVGSALVTLTLSWASQATLIRFVLFSLLIIEFEKWLGMKLKQWWGLI